MALKIKVRRTVQQFGQMAGAFARIREQQTDPESGTRAPVASLTLRCLRNHRVIESDAQAYAEKEGEFLMAHGERDAKNELVPLPGRPNLFAIKTNDEARAAWLELQAAASEEVEYELEPLDPEALDALGPLPAFVVDALEPLLIPEVE